MDMSNVEEIVRKVRALRALTEMTGTITRRSQGLLLQALSPEELTLAAELLQKDGQRDGQKEGPRT